MNYKLCTKSKADKTSRILDLSIVFINKEGEFNLEMLDKFTSQFKDEKELKAYLLSKKVISANEYHDDIMITYGLKNVRYIPVMYSNPEELNNLKELSSQIKSYFDHRKNLTVSMHSYETILDNYKNITEYFSVFEKISRSKQFLNLISGYVRSNPKQGINVDDIELFMRDDFGQKQCRYLYIALFELFRREFFDYDKENQELKFTYKGFRDFCVFYFNYKNENFTKKNESKSVAEASTSGFDGEQLMFKGYR